MKKYYITIIALLLFMTSCNDDSKNIKIDTTPAIAVKVSSISENNSNPSFTESGKIKAVNNTTLSTRISGFVEKIYVNVGDKVSAGQLLLSISNTDLKAKLAQVNSSITAATVAYKRRAEKDYNRFQNLVSDNSASVREMDDVTANFEMAKARLETANQQKNEINAQFKYVNLRAPFSGFITNKFIETGDLANPGMPLISMESKEVFRVRLLVSENKISEIKKGLVVPVLIKSISKTVRGVVTEVSSSSSKTGGQFVVKVTLDKTDAPILSGMYTSIKFPSKNKTASKLILIPRNVIVEKGQLSGIYTVSQSQTAMLRWLRLGKIYGDQIEVLSGLNADEQFIVSSEGKLFNGTKVSIQ